MAFTLPIELATSKASGAYRHASTNQYECEVPGEPSATNLNVVGRAFASYYGPRDLERQDAPMDDRDFNVIEPFLISVEQLRPFGNAAKAMSANNSPLIK